MTETNPYEANADSIPDAGSPPGRTRWYHVILSALMMLAIPLYVLMSAAAAWEFVFFARGRSQVSFAIWFVMWAGSAVLCWFANRQISAARPSAVLYAMLGLVGFVMAYAGNPLVYRLAKLLYP